MKKLILYRNGSQITLEETGFTNSSMFRDEEQTFFLNRLSAFKYYIDKDRFYDIIKSKDKIYQNHLIKLLFEDLLSIWKLYHNFSFFRIRKINHTILSENNVENLTLEIIFDWLASSFAANNKFEYNLAVLVLLKKFNIEDFK